MNVSLKDISCSDQILNQIQNSDLLFLEVKANSDFERLSKEEKQKLFIGSREEREEIMSRLSLESQKIVREREAVTDNFLQNALPFNIYSTTNGGFSELSPKSQEILTKYGVNIQGNHVDFVHFIQRIATYKALFSFPSLDSQIKKIALSHSIEIKALDDNKRVSKDFDDNKRIGKDLQATSSSKPSYTVDHTVIEQLIEGMDNLVAQIKLQSVQISQIYKLYDANRLREVVVSKLPSKKILLKNRNELWLEKFMEAHEKYENIFLAAGVAHFIGAHNMLDMLKEKGFSLSRMTCSQ